jgi:Uma2 family endonuclease
MSALLNASPPIMAPHWKISVNQYHLMGRVGILLEHDRVELIEGEIITMAPIGPVHSGTVNMLVELLGYPTAGRAIASVQNPIHLGSHSEPQPDFVLLQYRPDRYKSRLPEAADVLLLVEIADTSVHYDRDVKAALYARHGIPEYWIINIPERQIEVCLDPDSEARLYRNSRIVIEGTLAPICFPNVKIDAGELLR